MEHILPVEFVAAALAVAMLVSVRSWNAGGLVVAVSAFACLGMATEIAGGHQWTVWPAVLGVVCFMFALGGMSNDESPGKAVGDALVFLFGVAPLVNLIVRMALL